MVGFSASRSEYAMLGRMLCKARPEVASELLETLRPGEEKNLDRIYFFYSRFFEWRPEGLRESEARRIFVASMLLLFSPQIFSNDAVKVLYGFNQRISACFACKKQSTKRHIELARVAYRCYDDFKSQVDHLTDYLRKIN